MGMKPSTLDHETLPSRYTRLAFSGKFWQLLLALGLLGSAFYFLFPQKQAQVRFYCNRGDYQRAQELIRNLLEAQPGSAENHELAARIALHLGRPDKAIRHLEKALDLGAPARETWERLATLYQWNQEPRKAMEALEHVAALSQDDPELLRRLLGYYRRFGLWKKETSTILKILDYEKKLPLDRVYADIEPASLRTRLSTDPWMVLIHETLRSLADQVRSQPENTALRLLLRHFYYLRLNIEADLEARGASYAFDPKSLVSRAASGFVQSGLIRKGMEFFAKLDHRSKSGIASRFHYAEILAWSGLKKEALDVAARLIRVPEARPQDLLRIARWAGWLGDRTVETSALETAFRRFPTHPDVLVQYAAFLLREERYAEAFEVYSTLARMDRLSTEDLERFLDCAQSTNDPHRMEEAFRIARNLQPQDIRWLRREALWRLKRGDFTGASRLFRQIFSTDRGSPEDLWAWIDAARASGDKTTLALIARNAERLATDRPELLETAAFLYNESGHPSQAYRLYRKLLENDPANSSLLDALIACALSSNDRTLRDDVTRLILSLAADGGLPEDRAARKLLDLGALSQAIRLYEARLRQDPHNPEWISSLIRLYRWADQPLKAAKLLADVSDTHPRNFEAALNAARAYLEADEPENAVPYLERAVQIQPDDPALLRQLATVYGWLQQDEKRVSVLERLARLVQLSPEDTLFLARIHLDRHRPQKAVTVLELQAQRRTLTVDESLTLVHAYHLMGKPQKALTMIHDLASAHSDDPDFLATLGNHALWMDQMSVALQLYERALRLDPKNLAALKGSAQIYAWNNDPQRAMARFEQYNRWNPLDFEVHYQLGELYYANGRRAAAYREYRKAKSLIRRVERMESASKEKDDRF